MNIETVIDWYFRINDAEKEELLSRLYTIPTKKLLKFQIIKTPIITKLF